MPYSTSVLLAVKKQQKQHVSFFRSMFFRQEAFSQTEKVAIDKLVPSLRLAPFVSPVVAGKVRRKDGFQTTSYAPPYLKPKDEVSPDEMMHRMSGEALNGELSIEQRYEATVAMLLDDQEKSIDRTEEYMCVQAIMTGKFVAESKEHPAVELDYGRAPTNNIQLIGPARWSQLPASYDITDEIESYLELSTGVASVAVFDKKAFALFRKFDVVKEALKNTVNNGNSTLELAPQLKSVVQFKGMFGALAIYVYSGYYENESGAKQLHMPDNSVGFLPGEYDGVMAYGAIRDVKAIKSGAAAGKRWPKNWESDEPSAEFLMTQSAPMPVLPDADEIVAVIVDGPA